MFAGQWNERQSNESLFSRKVSRKTYEITQASERMLSRKPLLTASKKGRDENTALLFESFDRINACRANRSEAEAKWPQQ